METKQNDLPESLRWLFENRERLLHDDQDFNDYLIGLVQSGAMTASQAFFLYARRHNMQTIELANLTLGDMHPKPVALEFLDYLLSGSDISDLLKALDVDRISGGKKCSLENG